MLSGEPPFTGPTAQAIIARVMTEEPRSLTLQRKTIPPQSPRIASVKSWRLGTSEKVDRPAATWPMTFVRCATVSRVNRMPQVL